MAQITQAQARSRAIQLYNDVERIAEHNPDAYVEGFAIPRPQLSNEGWIG